MVSINKLLLTVFLSFSVFVSAAFAGDNHQLDSYIRTVYPKDIKSKRDLVTYILEGTDYKLYYGPNSPADSRFILSQSPDYQRERVLASRYDALLMAVGDDYSLIVDHVNKYVSVTRSPNYGLH